jgi:hypothetical protein
MGESDANRYPSTRQPVDAHTAVDKRRLTRTAKWAVDDQSNIKQCFRSSLRRVALQVFRELF